MLNNFRFNKNFVNKNKKLTFLEKNTETQDVYYDKTLTCERNISMKYLFVIAMQKEAKEIINHYELKK